MPFNLAAAHNLEGAIVAKGNRRVLLELAVGYGLILVVIWTPMPWQRWFFLAAIAWIIFATISSFDGWREIGLRAAGPPRSYWVVGAALLILAAAVAASSRFGTLHVPPGPVIFFRSFAGYALWAFLQQFLLQDFVLLRLLRLMSNRKVAVMTAAVLFGLGHLPSPILTPVTLLWGLVACWHFLRYRNLYPLALAHAIFGICIAITVPGTVDHNMRVGLGYLTYRPYQHHHRSQMDHKVSTVAWVTADAPIRRS